MRKWISFGAGLTVMCLATIANAQTPSSDLYSYASYANRVETLERELAQVHAKLASYGTEGGNSAKAYDDNCCGESSWFVGGEVAVLKPFVGLPAFQAFDYEATPRVWLGYEHGSGLGARATYWQFDNSNPDGTIDLDFRTLDLDVTQRGQFCNWDIVVFGGLRYGKIGVTEFVPQEEREFGFVFEGLGPTLGAEVRRPVGNRGWALVGNVRGSILFDDRLSIREEGEGPAPINDVSATVWQTQLGVEWSRCIFGSSHLVVRALYEAQAWNMGVDFFEDANVNFGGPTFTVGIVR
ncbi:MAG: hypothetical protein KJ000_03685 [Pirellulaceae bacterium]|nr:hypothetical protein [Pirellulaceae bacterium]